MPKASSATPAKGPQKSLFSFFQKSDKIALEGAETAAVVQNTPANSIFVAPNPIRSAKQKEDRHFSQSVRLFHVSGVVSLLLIVYECT
jgi:hypothetical protein